MEERLNPSHDENILEQYYTDELIEKLMALEGDCKIKSIIFLKINYLKAILLGLIFTLSVVGLLLLKNSIKLRAKILYTTISKQQLRQITHVYIQGQEGGEEISQIHHTNFDQSERMLFQYQKLKYEIFRNKWIPIGFPYIDRISGINHDRFLKEGLDVQSTKNREAFYGKNQHRVKVPGYLEYIFDTMSKPYFIFQYFNSLIFILKNIPLFGVSMIGFGFLTTSINYVLLRRSYNKIKETAQKLFKVKVLRNGKYEQIDNIDIVPGDLYEPSKEIPCDSILVKGELFVDQVNLTGENVPIAKSRILDNSKHSDRSHWLFQGSKLQTMKESTLALAVNVGYASQRGRIIRKILNKTSKQPQFFMKLIYFQLQVLMVSIAIYFVTLPQLLSLDIDVMMVIFRFFDFLTYSFPSAFPIFFNLAYSFCLVRLNRQNIIGTQPQKTVEGARMKTICFDKTGTLTLNKMSVANVFQFDSNQTTDITQQIAQNTLISSLFASCNSVEVIEGQVKGDQIDLRMFELTQAKVRPSQSESIVRSIILNGRTLQVLKIHQYESQFQSMSVLVRDSQTQRIYVFAKGSPQLIHHYSARKVHGFEKLIKDLSFKGLRSIGFGFREVSETQLQRQLLRGREECLMDTTILGVVTFVNLLKEDALCTVNSLTECEINTKIITGDNIFLGVQTAIAVGMIPKHSKVTVLEGNKYSKATNSIQALHLTQNENGSIQEHYEKIESFVYQNEPNHFYAIDNDFIRENPQGFMHEKVKVFARTSPQNKALIIRKHKQLIRSNLQNRKFWDKIIGQPSLRIGMVGDGANDLVALKQADVGIGISSTDAIYSSSFAVRQLSQIVTIICQSKNVERQIIEMSQYYLIISFLTITSTLALTYDSSYHTSMQLMYLNFLIISPITVLFAFSKPNKTLNKELPNSNFMGLENHLVFWLNCMVSTFGQVGALFYLYNSSGFQHNTQTEIKFPTGWNGECQSSTANFLIIALLYITLSINIYRSSPWKQKMYKNLPFTILNSVNFLVLILIYIKPAFFSILNLKEIPQNQTFIIFAIQLSASVICGVMNRIIQRKQMHIKNKNRLSNPKQQDVITAQSHS